MTDLLHFDAPAGWGPANVLPIDQPPAIGTPAEVRVDGLGVIDGLVVTHLYRFRCDDQPGEDYLVVASPGTPHVTIVHQADWRPAVSTEWAVGLGFQVEDSDGLG